VANAAAALDRAAYDCRIDLGIGDLHLHQWRRDGGPTAVLWYAGRGTKELVFPNDALREVTDLWGNAVPPQTADGGVELAAGRDPLYLALAGEGALQGVRLLSRRLVLPVADCHTVSEVNPERPVKRHTSPRHHGDRDVYGLPDVGDALGWTLAAIKPAHYQIHVELRTGSAGDLYGRLGDYRLTIVSNEAARQVELAPAGGGELQPVALTTPEGGSRAYGWAAAAETVWLAPGDEIRVAMASGGWGFVGALMLAESEPRTRRYRVPETAPLPQADGRLEDLPVEQARRLDRRQQVVIGVADPFASTAENDAWKGPEDLSARFWVGHHDRILYVAVDITDGGGLFPRERGPYNGDCIELFLDLRHPDQVGSPTVEPGVWQVFLRAPAPGAGARSDPDGRTPDGTLAAARRTERGWTAEFIVPQPETVDNGAIGLDIAIDDDDTGDGRKTQMVWHGTAQNFQDPSAYARFSLE
jgi:hypothetical protein